MQADICVHPPARADLAMALGARTDVAVETGDVVLMQRTRPTARRPAAKAASAPDRPEGVGAGRLAEDTAHEALRATMRGAFAPPGCRPSPYLFVSHGNRHRGDGRVHPRTVWAIVKRLARTAELADVQFAGLAAALHTHDTRYHYARTVLNRGANLSVVQDLLGHASPDTTKRMHAKTDRAVLREAAHRYAPRA